MDFLKQASHRAFTPRFVAKHETMNKHMRSDRFSGIGVITSPAFPFTGAQLFKDLRRRLAKELGLKMTLEQLSGIMGVPLSTVHYWLEACPHTQVIALMSLMERLSSREQNAFIEEHTRIFPTLSHPKLLWRPATQTYLFNILAQQRGLTTITGGTESSRSFVLTALGHSYRFVESKQRTPVGIDAHRPMDYVPVEGVKYIDASKGREHVRNCVQKIWLSVVTSRASLVLLNGIWSSMPEMRLEICRLSRHKHVVITGHDLKKAVPLSGIRRKGHVLTLAPPEYGSDRLQIHFFPSK